MVNFKILKSGSLTGDASKPSRGSALVDFSSLVIPSDADIVGFSAAWSDVPSVACNAAIVDDNVKETFFRSLSLVFVCKSCDDDADRSNSGSSFSRRFVRLFQ